MSRAKPLPGGKWFFDHIVSALGELTMYRAYVGIPIRQVEAKVLDLAGIDPETCPWRIRGKPSVCRNIGFAFRNQRANPKKGPYCYSGNRIPLTTYVDGKWALTAAGVEKAITISTLPTIRKAERSPIPVEVRPKPNLTAQWVASKGATLRNRLIQYLGTRFGVSKRHDLIEDHVQQFLTDFIKRDSLRSRLESGQKVHVSQVCSFARNNTNSQIRNNARNPVCRELHGARTKKERESTSDSYSTHIHVKQAQHMSHIWNTDEEVWTNPLENLVDNSDSVQLAEDKISFDEKFKVFVDALNRRDPQTAEEYSQILVDRFVMDMTVREIAEKRGITRNKAATMLRSATLTIKRDRACEKLASTIEN